MDKLALYPSLGRCRRAGLLRGRGWARLDESTEVLEQLDREMAC
jgi:hypothetical protein